MEWILEHTDRERALAISERSGSGAREKYRTELVLPLTNKCAHCFCSGIFHKFLYNLYMVYNIYRNILLIKIYLDKGMRFNKTL